MPEPKKAGLWRYLKEAFLFKWNLLILGGAAAGAALSGHADVALPLVAAAEVTYLAGLTTLPRFQGAIDAKARAEERGSPIGPPKVPVDTSTARDRILEVLKSLTEDRRSRFLRLRARCVEMTRIANAVRGETRDASGAAESIRTPALDRLLYLFLRLLVSQNGLDRFLRSTSEKDLEAKLTDVRTRLEAAKTAGDERVKNSQQDSVADAELRLDNYRKAAKDAEFVAIELDRIETKIQALIEMGVSRQDPDYLSHQVTAAAESMQHTEAAVNELQHLTGLADQIEEPPAILESTIAGLVARDR